ncbi:MAG: DNA-deoxyinosine glycosylase [Proteobacteria bacterium]|nr:DNA-deoxyinosine glycosylase [Pseudomonadota bacterium]
MTTPVCCFPPVEDSNARILILGSMPGRESLKAAQYYAHPRNAFWRIMGELTGANPSIPYQARIQILKSAGIALWDVLASCQRHSSLDSDITSMQVNDFETFFLSNPHIEQVCLNGAMAEKCYLKQVLPTLKPRMMRHLRLPSTSPAHASIPYDQKLDLWRRLIPIQTDKQ